MARISREDAVGLLMVSLIAIAGAAFCWAIWTGWIYSLPAWRAEWIG